MLGVWAFERDTMQSVREDRTAQLAFGRSHVWCQSTRSSDLSSVSCETRYFNSEAPTSVPFVEPLCREVEGAIATERNIVCVPINDGNAHEFEYPSSGMQCVHWIPMSSPVRPLSPPVDSPFNQFATTKADIPNGSSQKLSSLARMGTIRVPQIKRSMRSFRRTRPAYGRQFRIIAALTGSILIVVTMIAGLAALVAVNRGDSLKSGNSSGGDFGTRPMSEPISSRTPMHVELGGSSHFIFAKRESARDEALANRVHWIFRPGVIPTSTINRIDGGHAKDVERSQSQSSL
jgi:hypothetical protein